jgi:predicted NBD/HSP70 family sugar kinase
MNILVIDIGGTNIKILATGLGWAIHPDDIVLGGGNSKNLKELPPGCRRGDNSFAFTG